jgi:hypothetical protein
MVSAAVADAVVASGICLKANVVRITFLLNNLRSVPVSSGHTVLTQDDPSGALFLIASGKVKALLVWMSEFVEALTRSCASWRGARTC